MANLTGYDLSSHNTAAQLQVALGLDFVIVKASEGVTYTNPTHDPWVAQARAEGLLVGHYHYAHPETNGPEAEARAFLAAAKPLPGEVLVLDFEPPTIMPTYPSWVIGFANAITVANKAPCWFYTNQSQGKSMVSLSGPEQRTALYKMPLWKAYYQSQPGDPMGWPEVTCWQKTDNPIDTNEFFGDAARWRSLGVPEETMALTDADAQLFIRALRADFTKTDQNADGSWPLGAVLTSRVADTVAYVLRTEGVSGAGDAGRIAAAVVAALPTAAQIATAVADEDHRRSEN